jgi:nucleoside-diphosphate-sugar epimerase
MSGDTVTHVAPAPVLLLGAGGFIGRHVLASLLERGHEVWAVSRKPRQHPEPQAHSLLHEIIARDGNYCAQIPGLSRFNLVHCAWCKPRTTRWGEHAEQVELMARTLEVYGSRIDRVVALGSAEEYGSREGCLTEAHVSPQPASCYAWGKSALRTLLQWWCTVSGKQVVWLRPFTVYGEGQGNEMVIPFAIDCALARKVARFSAGTQKRDFVHVSDVARGVVASIEADISGFRAINLGTSIPTELVGVLRYIENELSARELFRYGVLPMRPHEPQIQFADISLARELLKWTPRVDIETGIAQLCRYYSRNHG